MLGRFNTTYYPLGFVGEKYENHIDGNPCTEAMRIYNTHANLDNSADLKRLRISAIELFMDKFEPFGGFLNFIDYNLREARITDLSRAFLMDTFRFIKTGRRHIDIMSWEPLLANDKSAKLTNKGYEVRFGGLAHGELDTSLSEWLAQDGGFLDMIWSMKILFGELDKPRF